MVSETGPNRLPDDLVRECGPRLRRTRGGRAHGGWESMRSAHLERRGSPANVRPTDDIRSNSIRPWCCRGSSTSTITAIEFDQALVLPVRQHPQPQLQRAGFPRAHRRRQRSDARRQLRLQLPAADGRDGGRRAGPGRAARDRRDRDPRADHDRLDDDPRHVAHQPGVLLRRGRPDGHSRLWLPLSMVVVQPRCRRRWPSHLWRGGSRYGPGARDRDVHATIKARTAASGSGSPRMAWIPASRSCCATCAPRPPSWAVRFRSTSPRARWRSIPSAPGTARPRSSTCATSVFSGPTSWSAIASTRPIPIWRYCGTPEPRWPPVR